MIIVGWNKKTVCDKNLITSDNNQNKLKRKTQESNNKYLFY